MAGHDFMDFRWAKDGSSRGGSDGCINFEDGDNKGLPECLAKSGTIASYNEKFADAISLADYFVMIAEAMMGRIAPDWDASAPYTGASLSA